MDAERDEPGPAAVSDERPILLEQVGPITTITLNRPAKLNALDIDAWRQLSVTLDEVRDSDARVVILRGAGNNFCSGADIRSPGSQIIHPLHRMEIISGTVRRLFELPKPVIAGVDGVAVGAGWNLALACDFVIATERSRFSQIFARRGLSVDCGGSWLLPRLVGPQQARRLLYLAEMLSAAEVDELGLLLRRVAPEGLDTAVDELAGRLAAAPPIAIQLDKQLLASSWGNSFAEQLVDENAAQLINFATDAPVARTAIEQHETPTFEGTWQL